MFFKFVRTTTFSRRNRLSMYSKMIIVFDIATLRARLDRGGVEKSNVELAKNKLNFG